MKPITPNQEAAAIMICQHVADAIRELRTVPAGHLYAAMMGKGFTLADFNAIIGTLTRAKLIANRGHVLTWIGPSAATTPVDETSWRAPRVAGDRS